MLFVSIMFFSILFLTLIPSFYFIYYPTILFWNVFVNNYYVFNIVFILDYVSVLFVITVLIIARHVALFASFYLTDDFNIIRFSFLYVSFVLSIIIFILSGNLICIILGWDGLGLSSFLLVAFYNSPNSSYSGFQTVLTNRIGDCIILSVIGFMLTYIYYLPLFLPLFLVFAATTKSAQWPFSSWLPIAMAAPTPISALVHSSTLVTAGVYLLLRFYYYFAWDYAACDSLLFISCITIIIAGMAGANEYDLKKIIAYSTLRQLGLIIYSVSAGIPLLTYYHLLVHAIFKSVIFLSAGMILIAYNHNQDIRFLSGRIYYIPLNTSVFIISNLSLCAFPFMAGFYRKDFILHVSIIWYFNYITYCILIIATGLTSYYSFRAVYYILMSPPSFSPLYRPEPASFTAIISTFSLIIFSITSGVIFGWILLPTNYPTLLTTSQSIFPLFLVTSGVFWAHHYSSEFFFINSIYSYFFSSISLLNPISNTNFLPKFNSFSNKNLYINEIFWAEKIPISFFSFSINLINLLISYFEKNNLFFSLFLIFSFILLIILLILL